MPEKPKKLQTSKEAIDQILKSLPWQDRVKLLEAGLKHISTDQLRRTELLYYKALGLSEQEIDRRMKMKEHHVKCWPEFYAMLEQGLKPFELRKNDRDYQVGDRIHQHEWDPAEAEHAGYPEKGYTGRVTVVTVLSAVPLNVVPGFRKEDLLGGPYTYENYVLLGIQLPSLAGRPMLHPKVLDFAHHMDKDLDTHSGKGTWDPIGLSVTQLIDQLKTHTWELERAAVDFFHRKETPEGVLKKAIALSNYALFVANHVGALGPAVFPSVKK